MLRVKLPGELAGARLITGMTIINVLSITIGPLGADYLVTP